jgi:hypothetical protein
LRLAIHYVTIASKSAQVTGVTFFLVEISLRKINLDLGASLDEIRIIYGFKIFDDI